MRDVRRFFMMRDSTVLCGAQLHVFCQKSRYLLVRTVRDSPAVPQKSYGLPVPSRSF
jgi:hypothetical protein